MDIKVNWPPPVQLGLFVINPYDTDWKTFSQLIDIVFSICMVYQWPLENILKQDWKDFQSHRLRKEWQVLQKVKIWLINCWASLNSCWATADQLMSNGWDTDQLLLNYCSATLTNCWATADQLLRNCWPTDKKLLKNWSATAQKLLSNC